MSLKDYRFDGEEKLELRGMNTGAKKDGVDKEDILRRTEKNLGRIEALQDKLRLKRVAAVAVIAVIGTAVSLCIQAIVSDWMDVVSIYICPLGALLAGILFFWVAGKDFVLAAVNKGAGKPIGAWFYPLSKYVYCVCALLALIAGALLGGIG